MTKALKSKNSFFIFSFSFGCCRAVSGATLLFIPFTVTNRAFLLNSLDSETAIYDWGHYILQHDPAEAISVAISKDRTTCQFYQEAKR
jgi:hypothetical protein